MASGDKIEQLNRNPGNQRQQLEQSTLSQVLISAIGQTNNSQAIQKFSHQRRTSRNKLGPVVGGTERANYLMASQDLTRHTQASKQSGLVNQLPNVDHIQQSQA
mmetsp:Transcript_15899/g.26796  ORF Transcript_15899/g.26796 Transcript_15899/m.26796 type:complete len:104 (+) Transcript_15899:59-370(+)